MANKPEPSKFDLARISTIVSIVAGVIGIVIATRNLMHDVGSGGAKTANAPTVPVVLKDDRNEELYRRYLRIDCAADGAGRGNKGHLDFEIKVQRIMPYYLLNTLKESRKYLYWTAYNAASTCGECGNLTIKLYSKNNEIALIDLQDPSFSYLICPKGTQKDTDIDPGLRFNKDKSSGTLGLQWTLTLQNHVPIEDVAPIRVLPVENVYWDLKTPDGKNVPFEFLLASLSAWTLAQSKEVTERGESYPEQELVGWLEHCYRDLFHNARHPLVVERHEEAWPPAGKEDESVQLIKVPEQALKARSLDSIEALLLVSALEYSVFKESNRLVLVAIPSGPQGRKRFLLAWPSERAGWQALDFGAPHRVSFGENLRAASALVNGTLNNAAILRELDRRGVYAAKDRQLLALDLVKASQHYQIKGLP